ncbi:ChaN family lipoprotein [Marinobacter sp.]|uniref:ChaN family lipoprotein n=1 Tax=Marinobacter sp. TaxID=50741 RepID=UPI0019DAD94C|nr:ChaN family lipoprotein [Marinobacter sp.]MBE0486561.1 ChaN family lipoprotein [Marinobacter sp.]
MASIKHLLAPLTTAGFAALTGCAQLPAQSAADITEPTSLYDRVLIDSPSAQPVSLSTLAEQLAPADVVVIGEYHGHQASHLLQARLQQQLHRINGSQVLTLEQFTIDHQPALDDYLAGITGETEMLEDAQAWDNYRGSYRPLVEYARRHNLPVIAANAPAEVVRCVGRTGQGYMDKLPAEQRLSLPEQPFLDTPAYRKKFETAISGSHGTGDPAMAERMDNTYKAQLLRDNTMAMRILQARDHYPEHQIVHLTGTFHSEERLGTVALLAHHAPDLSVAVISPVFWPADSPAPLAGNLDKGDYLYLIQPLPPEFRDSDRQRSAMQERFSSRPDIDCNTGE